MAQADEHECRICRGEDEPERPLLHPCKCSGSIRYTHEECLVNWLSQSGSVRCELCNHPFRFEPLYQPNTPSALPTYEFFIGVLGLTKKAIKTVARIILVFTVWLFFLPVGTCWTWYALFIGSPSELPALLASRGPSGIVTDAFYGFLLSAGIVFIFLGVSSLREYVRNFPQDAVGAHDEDGVAVFMNPDEIPPDDFGDFELEDFAVHELGVVRHHFGERNDDVGMPVQDGEHFEENRGEHEDPDLTGHVEDIDAEVVDEVDAFVRDTLGGIGADGMDLENDIPPEMLVEESDEEEQNQHFARDEAERDPRALGDFAADNVVGDDAGSLSDLMDDDEYHVDDALDDALVEHIADDMEVDNDDLLDDEDDQEGRGDGGALFGLFELDPDEVPLEEVVGLRGPIRNLFDNAGTVLISNAVFLGVFTLIPLLIGRFTLRLFSLNSFPLRLYVGPDEKGSLQVNVLSLLQATTGGGLLKAGIAAKNASEAIIHNVTSLSGAAKNGSDALEKLAASVRVVSDASGAKSEVALHTSRSTPDQPLVSYVDNFLIVLLGYGVIALGAVAYIGVMSMLRQRYPRFDSPLTRQIARMLRYIATFVKVVVLTLFEFGIFPLGCGWWLDICTLDIIGGNLQSRLAYCHESPWSCTGAHWFMGIIYSVHISCFFSVLHEVLKPELLWFLRNPADPDYPIFKELVEKPLSRHARRICISVIIYAPLMLALVYAPAQLCLKLLPSVFPFRSEDFSHILIDVPFGNLLIGPLIRLLYNGNPEVFLVKGFRAWVRAVSTALGIEHLVLQDENEREAALRIPQENGGMVAHDDAGPLQRMFEDEPDLALDDVEPLQDADGDVDSADGSFVDVVSEERRKFVALRAAVMILLSWLTLVFAECVLLSVPTILGRWLMGTVGLPVRHDLHPFLLGLNSLLGSIRGISKIVEYLRTLDTVTMLSMGLPYLMIGVKGLIIVAIWLGIIPLASGLLFELILLPIRVAHNETPYFCVHQDWALGLLFLKVWSYIAVTGGLGAKWRERVLRARDGDIIGLDQNFGRSMREVVIPVLVSVITALAIPYSIARGLIPLFGASRWLSNLIYRYSYLVLTGLFCGYETMRYSASILRDLHDAIRDDKYLVGKRLYNFSDVSETVVPPQEVGGNR